MVGMQKYVQMKKSVFHRIGKSFDVLKKYFVVGARLQSLHIQAFIILRCIIQTRTMAASPGKYSKWKQTSVLRVAHSLGTVSCPLPSSSDFLPLGAIDREHYMVSQTPKELSGKFNGHIYFKSSARAFQKPHKVPPGGAVSEGGNVLLALE